MRRRTYTISLANRKARGSGHERFSEILRAARRLFVERGVENVTTRQIAQRVGISQAALFAYYKTKDDIFAALIRDAFAELDHAMRQVEDSAADYKDWIKQGVRTYVEFGLSHADAYRLAFMVIKARKRGGKAKSTSQGEVGIPVFMRLVSKIEEGMNAGLIRQPGSAMLVAQVFWASMHGLVAILIARPKPHFPWEGLDALIDAQVSLLSKALLE